MTTQRIFTSRSQHASNTYIGAKGQLFYNELTGALRLSNGVTPGGVSVAIDANLITTESIVPEVDNVYGIGSPELRWNHVHVGDGGIYFDGNQTTQAQTTPYIPGAVTSSIVPSPTDASLNLGSPTHRWGDLYIGSNSLHFLDQTTLADVSMSVDNGTLYLNGAQSLQIGNLTIVDTTLTNVTSNLNISIGNQGDTGFFYVNRKAQFDTTSFSSTEPMVSFNASGGPDPETLFADTVLQTVGRPNKNSRIVQRSYGSTGNVGGDNAYSVWASYAARGTVAAPEATKANDILVRLSANGYGTTSWGSGGARVEFVASENFTDTAKGSKIKFWTVPEGQITSQNVASINSTGIDTASVKFTADGSTQTTAGIPLTAKAITSATYVATLGVDGKLDSTQIPSSLSGAVVFKGTWNATTNIPELSDSTPADLLPGWEYIVDVGGTRDIGDGSKLFVSGDFVIYDGTHWKQVPSGNLFTSLTGGGHITVNQSTGAIVLGSDATPNATTATIVSRDASGNFSANVITANLTGVVTGSVSGNAGSVTNGVYTTGNQNIGGTKTFTSTIQGTITSATYANSFNTSTLVANAVTAGYATTFNTSTLVANAVTAGYANTFNTSTLVANAVSAISATTAGTVTTAAQPAITSVGTLTSLSVTNLVTANTYAGQARNAGTLGAGGTLVIDFATDHNVLVNLTTTAVIGFVNTSSGKTVTVMVKNASGNNRAVTLGVVAGNTSGGNAAPNVNDGRTGVLIYRTFGTATTDVYCEFN